MASVKEYITKVGNTKYILRITPGTFVEFIRVNEKTTTLYFPIDLIKQFVYDFLAENLASFLKKNI